MSQSITSVNTETPRVFVYMAIRVVLGSSRQNEVPLNIYTQNSSRCTGHTMVTVGFAIYHS